MKLNEQELLDLINRGIATPLDTILDSPVEPHFKRLLQDTQELNIEALQGILTQMNSRKVKGLKVNRNDMGLIETIDFEYID